MSQVEANDGMIMDCKGNGSKNRGLF